MAKLITVISWCRNRSLHVSLPRARDNSNIPLFDCLCVYATHVEAQFRGRHEKGEYRLLHPSLHSNKRLEVSDEEEG